MRAGPLSDPRVIRLLNEFYVPVYVSNEDYVDEGGASDEEKRERLRVFRAAREAGLSVGTVHAYILAPDGRPIDSRHVAEAARVETLVEMLQHNAAQLNASSGPPVVAPCAQSRPPEADVGELLLHVTARVLSGGAWGELPGENWIALDSSDARRLLPPAGHVASGTSWDVDPQLSQRLLTYFYPATENNDASPDRIERHWLRGRVVGVERGVARALIEGELQMRHNFYYQDDGRRVEARLVGYLDFAADSGRIERLRLVTDQATYNQGTFGVSLESRSPAD